MTKSVSTVLLLISCFSLLNLVSCIKNDTELPPRPVVVDKCSGAAGPLFTDVKNLITKKCVFCHKTSNASGGKDFTSDCNIINAQAQIKSLSVDLNVMPPSGPLSAAEKGIITTWITAGGKITN